MDFFLLLIVVIMILFISVKGDLNSNKNIVKFD